MVSWGKQKVDGGFSDKRYPTSCLGWGILWHGTRPVWGSTTLSIGSLPFPIIRERSSWTFVLHMKTICWWHHIIPNYPVYEPFSDPTGWCMEAWKMVRQMADRAEHWEILRVTRKDNQKTYPTDLWLQTVWKISRVSWCWQISSKHYHSRS